MMHTLRRQILTARDGLPNTLKAHYDHLIFNRLVSMREVATAKTMFTYVSYHNEVDTVCFMQWCFSKKMVVAVPLTISSSKTLLPIPICSIENDLVHGYKGILEPKAEQVNAGILPPADIDIIIIPGLVFDEGGGRIGYGGGYYDRFLAENSQPIRIALAYELQMVQHLELQAHDQIMDCIVTEQRLIRITKRH